MKRVALSICRICHAKVHVSKVTGNCVKHWNKFLKESCDGSGKKPCVLERLKNE